MPLFSYNTSVPNGPNNPSADQPIMQNNTLQTNNIIDVDHFSFNQANGGLHRQVNLVTEASPGLQGNLVLYTALAGGQSALWAKNATQDLPLFTGTASGNTNGHTSTFGGIILQWGRVTGLAGIWPTTDQTLTFTAQVPANIAFTNLFAVFTTFIGPTSSTSGDICINALNPTNFHWQFTGSSSSFDGFYWWAVGN